MEGQNYNQTVGNPFSEAETLLVIHCFLLGHFFGCFLDLCPLVFSLVLSLEFLGFLYLRYLAFIAITLSGSLIAFLLRGNTPVVLKPPVMLYL